MKMPTRSSQLKGYHGRDAQLALQLLVDSKRELTYKDISEATGMHPWYISMCLKAVTHSTLVRDYVRIYDGPKPKAYTRTHYVFTEDEYDTMARFIGRQCGFKKNGFVSVAAMIGYVQARPEKYPLPEGASWIRTNYPSQSDEMDQAHAIRSLERYRVAAVLFLQKLEQEDGIRFETLVEGMNDYLIPKFKAYVLQTKTAHHNPLLDPAKVEGFEQFAGALGKALKLKEPLDPDAMLKLAQKEFPGRIPRALAAPKHRFLRDHDGFSR